MPKVPLTIWCNAEFPPAARQLLIDRTTRHRLVFSQSLLRTNLVGSGQDAEARAADVVFGQPHPDDVMQSSSMQWVHLNSAGYTRYDRDDLRTAMRQRGAAMTNSSGVYADPCAQHVLAFMLARARRLPDALAAQIAEHGWPYTQLRPVVRVLTGETAMIFGFGSIARRLVELLAPYRMTLIGVRRSVRGDETIRTIAASDVDQFLPQADHVINVMPAGAETARFFNAARFSKMKPTASFYNVGRGDTVDQPALIDALTSKRFAAAYLDVTTPEPLPPSDPLWSAPNCYITPHLAGGHQDEQRHLVEHFLENLSRYERGETLADRII